MNTILLGRVWKYGDDVNTDVIIPARYCTTHDALELAKHCMEDIDKDFIRKVRPGDIIVAGENFGCGSSREHAPIALRGAGVSCVIARSFSRIFFRTSVNTGFPVFELSNAYDITEEDELLIDMGEGTATNLTCDEVYPLPSLPPFLKQIFFCGGLLEFIKQRG